MLSQQQTKPQPKLELTAIPTRTFGSLGPLCSNAHWQLSSVATIPPSPFLPPSGHSTPPTCLDVQLSGSTNCIRTRGSHGYYSRTDNPPARRLYRHLPLAQASYWTVVGRVGAQRASYSFPTPPSQIHGCLCPSTARVSDRRGNKAVALS